MAQPFVARIGSRAVPGNRGDDAARHFADAIVPEVGDVEVASRIQSDSRWFVEGGAGWQRRMSPLKFAVPVPAIVVITPAGRLCE